MANMSYCRFENTLSDLQDCLDHINDRLSSREAKARSELIALCQEIADLVSDDDIDDEDEDSDEE